MPPILLPLVRYDLTLDNQPEPFWKVESVSISESLNHPCRASLAVSTEAEIDTDALLGASAVLTIQRETLDPQFLCGVVAQVDYLGVTDDIIRLRLQLVSSFELLRQEVDSNIWPDAAPLDIIEELLTTHFAPYERTYDVSHVSRGHELRDYCVQYRESVFDFVCRLLEEEGISYAFVHDGDKGHEVLTLFDANNQYKPIKTDTELLPTDTLPIVEHNPSHFGSESLQGIEWSRVLTSTATLRHDFDWKHPEDLLSSKADATDHRGRTRRIYMHTDRRFMADDLEARALDLQASSALAGAVCRGRGNATVLRPGVRFKVAGDTRGDLAREYIVTGVRHAGQPESGCDYVNDFDCVPSEAEIRPLPLTPKPRVYGPHTALVTGDEEIHTDKHGRIQVQFSWEREPSNAAGSSCWIRCAQSWAGARWGAQFIPRVGMEVVVEFVEGNPDRPLVTGCVFNGAHDYPFLVPDKKTQSGWRTRSSPDSEGFNELRFEDAAGAEEIFVHAERDLNVVVKAAESRCVGASRSTSIGDCDTLDIKKDYKITLAEGSRTVTISEGDDALTVTEGGASRSVPAGNDKLSAKTVEILGADSITLTCGGSTVEIKPSEVSVTSTLIKLNA